MAQTHQDGRSERIQKGRAARRHLPRRDLREFPKTKTRRDPIELLHAAAKERLPKLLPVKYARMSVSPFAFFRGAVAIMAADLSLLANTGTVVQLCGDAHVQNLGWFETPDGRIVFDLNDFDETIAGPSEWDVKRMATSLILAGAESDHSHSESLNAAEEFVEVYCEYIEELSAQPILVAARHQLRRLSSNLAVGPAFQQAKRATPLELLKKYTIRNGRGQTVFTRSPNLWRIGGQAAQSVLASLKEYRMTLRVERRHFFDFFSKRDVAFKIVGTGSVGLQDYVVLMEGNGRKDPLFLQIKQEIRSAYQPYLPRATRHRHDGMRVVEGQRRIQPISDLLLGWTRMDGHDYLVRQLNDHKGSIEMENLKGRGLSDLAYVAGRLLARGHARSGDALEIASYIGSGDSVVQAIVAYASAAAEATIDNFDAFKKAIEKGAIKISAKEAAAAG